MRVTARWGNATLALELHPEEGDGGTGRARLRGSAAMFRLPAGLGPDDVHPDLEALLALLVVQPFSAQSVTLSRGVSPSFAAAVEGAFKRSIGPVDPAVGPRQRPSGGVVGLAYSAGADSTAALALLPPETVAFFLRRVDPPGPRRRTSYSDEAAMHACHELARQGRQVHIIESDVEHVREPVGFSTDWINGAGAILLADRERLDSLAWGLIAESAYGIGHERFVDWGQRQRTGWGAVFAAAGLPMCQPVAGISEVGTAAIVRQAPEGALAQSCIRGTVGAPCRNCWKCFRKSLLDAALTDNWPGPRELDRLFHVPEAHSVLAKYPIKHEDVVAWTTGRYGGQHRFMQLLAARTRPDRLDLDWLTRYYGPSLDLLPERHRAVVTARLAGYLDPMAPEDEARMQAWDMRPFLADPATEAARDALIAALGPPTGSGRARMRRLARRIRMRLGAT